MQSKKQCSRKGFAFYLDAYANPPGSAWYYPPLNGSRAAALQSNLKYAAQATDEYIWTWGEHHRWFPPAGKTENLQSWEDVIPGISQALLSIVQPQSSLNQAWQAVKHEEAPINLVKNGDFVNPVNPKVSQTTSASDDKTSNVPTGWETWQREDTKGTFNQDTNVTHRWKRERLR